MGLMDRFPFIHPSIYQFPVIRAKLSKEYVKVKVNNMPVSFVLFLRVTKLLNEIVQHILHHINMRMKVDGKDHFLHFPSSLRSSYNSVSFTVLFSSSSILTFSHIHTARPSSVFLFSLIFVNTPFCLSFFPFVCHILPSSLFFISLSPFLSSPFWIFLFPA